MISAGARHAIKLGGLLVFGAGGHAIAQVAAPTEGDLAVASAPANGVIAYPPSFFTEFRPSTAQDMINRVPGFVYNPGDQVRGFGGAAGNVLIDGERPSSKAVTLDEAIRRILATQVERIDLIRGGAPGVDMQGQAVVVNIIRRKGADTSVTLEFMGKLYNDHQPGMAPRIDASTRLGDLRLSGAASARIEKHQGETGNGNFIRRNGAGAVTARGPFAAEVENRVYAVNGAAEYGDFRVNIGADRVETPRNEYAVLTNLAGARNTEQTVNDLVSDKAEIGADYQHALAFGLTGRVVGLYTYKASDLVSVQTGRGATSRSTKKTDGYESILRGSVRGLFQGLTVEAGGEVAFNSLDIANSLTTGGVAVVLPSASVLVEEQRAEGFLTASVKPVPRLSIDAGVRVEVSTITQSGDVAKEKTLAFPKPRLTLAYAVSPSIQLRGRLERTVGQLNFEDFAASGDLSAGVLNVGNSNLEPERAWVTELAWEQRFWGKGALVLTATHSAVEGVVDVIPVFSGSSVFDAPGNLGSGTKDELNANLTLPFDNLGLKGLDLRANYTWRRTRVKDPTTGEMRPFSTLDPWNGSFTLTQDLPRLKSTFVINSMGLGYKARQYRSNETRFDYLQPNYINVQYNWRPNPKLVVTLQLVENAFSRERRRERVIYSGPRSNGVVNISEERSAEMEPFFMFRIRKTL
jgi:outer membrane receptor for ferrienterochelin and colicin